MSRYTAEHQNVCRFFTLSDAHLKKKKNYQNNFYFKLNIFLRYFNFTKNILLKVISKYAKTVKLNTCVFDKILLACVFKKRWI